MPFSARQHRAGLVVAVPIVLAVTIVMFASTSSKSSSVVTLGQTAGAFIGVGMTVGETGEERRKLPPVTRRTTITTRFDAAGKQVSQVEAVEPDEARRPSVPKAPQTGPNRKGSVEDLALPSGDLRELALFAKTTGVSDFDVSSWFRAGYDGAADEAIPLRVRAGWTRLRADTPPEKFAKWQGLKLNQTKPLLFAEVKAIAPDCSGELAESGVEAVLVGEEALALDLIGTVGAAYAAGGGPPGFRSDGCPMSKFESEIQARWPTRFKILEETWRSGRRVRRPSDIGAADLGIPVYLDVEVHQLEWPLALPFEAGVVCGKCRTEAVAKIPAELAIYALDSRGRPPTTDGLAIASAPPALFAAGCECGETQVVHVQHVRSADYSRLTVGDIPSDRASAEGREDVALDVHLVGPPPPGAVGRLRLYGNVYAHPRARRVEMVATDFRELEGRPVASAMTTALRERFAKIGRMTDAEWHTEVGPGAVGMEAAKEACALAMCSLTRIRLPDPAGGGRGDEERGTLNVVLIGDTTTGKGLVATDIPEGMKIGGIVHGESAGRTGLVYTLSQNQATGRWTLRWGKLPRFHGQLVVINEAGLLPREEIPTYRSIRREQKVIVDRAAVGARPVAFREISTLNPDGGLTMAQFTVPAEALLSSIYRYPADVARTDLVVTVGASDVEFARIAEKPSIHRPFSPEDLRPFVFWIWSLRSEDIVWAAGTAALLTTEAIRVERLYQSRRIPLVNNALVPLIARVSCAYAARSFSTDATATQLIVNEDHVRRAVAFLEKMWLALGLDVMRAREQQEEVGASEAYEICLSIGRHAFRVLMAMAGSQDHVSASEIAQHLGQDWTTKTVQYQLDALHQEKLIETRSGAGSRLSARGATFVRLVQARDAGTGAPTHGEGSEEV